MEKEWFGLAAAALGFANYAPLFWGIYKGKSKPHLFTYLVWSTATGVAWAAQMVEGAGPGAWAALISLVLTLMVCVLALRYGHKDITRSDWLFLVLGFGAIPVWVVTKSPFYAACIATLVDGLGYLPTFRKTWMRPHEENATQYIFANLKWICSFAAMANLNPTTLVYPVVIMGLNTLLLLEISLRRRVLGLHP